MDSRRDAQDGFRPGSASGFWIHHRRIILFTSFLVACSGYVILERMNGRYGASASMLCDNIDVEQPLKKIRDTLASKHFHNQTEFLDHVLWLTNRYTIHVADAWHDRNWQNRDLVLAHLYRAMRGDESARPHSSCGPRCIIMAWILQSYGIKSRQLATFSSKYPDLIVGHQQIEILNPDSGRWELYDPTWNVHFVNEESGQRASALDLYFRPVKIREDGEAVFEGVIPSNRDGSLRGWDALYPFSNEQTTPIANCADYGAIMYYCFQTECTNEILVNVHRFDVNKTWDYPDRGLVQTTFAGYCRKVHPNSFMHVLEGPPPGKLKDRLEKPGALPSY